MVWLRLALALSAGCAARVRCVDPAEPAPAASPVLGSELVLAERLVPARVDEVRFEGSPLSDETLRAAARHPAPARLDETLVQADVRRLWALEVFEDVRARVQTEGDATALVYTMRTRPHVRRVQVRGDAGREAAPFLALRGGLHDEVRLRRMRGRAEAGLRRRGHLDADASFAIRDARTRGRTVGVCVDVHVEPGPVVHVRGLRVHGAGDLRDAIHEVFAEDPAPGAPFDAERLPAARARVLAWLYERGFAAAEVPRVRVQRSGDDVLLHLRVAAGAVHRVRAVEGLDEERAARLRGRLFVRSEVYALLEDLGGAEQASIETELGTDDEGAYIDLRFVPHEEAE